MATDGCKADGPGTSPSWQERVIGACHTNNVKQTMTQLASAHSRCRCCEAAIPVAGPRQCPECRHVFRGNGWDGIDAHWRAKHESTATYEEFWSSLCDGHLKDTRE